MVGRNCYTQESSPRPSPQKYGAYSKLFLGVCLSLDSGLMKNLMTWAFGVHDVTRKYMRKTLIKCTVGVDMLIMWTRPIYWLVPQKMPVNASCLLVFSFVSVKQFCTVKWKILFFSNDIETVFLGNHLLFTADFISYTTRPFPGGQTNIPTVQLMVFSAAQRDVVRSCSIHWNVSASGQHFW